MTGPLMKPTMGMWRSTLSALVCDEKGVVLG